MMWLSLIKSSEGLNRNLSNKSQNRIGFKFGLCTYLSVWIITFSQISDCNDIVGVGKLIKNETNMLEIYFS
jgi:hypothetical protein